MFIEYLPKENPKLHNQTNQTEISDEEFSKGLVSTPTTKFQRIIQVLLFIIGFGWLRLIFLIIFTIIFLILELPLIIFCYKKTISNFLLPFGNFIGKLYIRSALFCFGIYKINVKGKIDDSAKALAFNHLTILDGPMIYFLKVFRVISMKEMLKVPFFGRVLVAINSVFIDRSVTSGASSQISTEINNSNIPVGLSPEGKTTKGNFLLKFHTGGFLTNNNLQPISIRYKTYFTFGVADHKWLVGGFKEFIWRCLCIPFGKAEINFLPIIKLNNNEPIENALKCQLIIANDLGILATNRSNREIYKNKKN